MLQTECGYTPDEIRAMTLLDVQRLSSHWSKHPPLRMLVSLCASSLGVKLPAMEAAKTKRQYMTAEEFAAQVQRINAVAGGNG